MKWLSNLLKGASLTTALFIFQACYGTYEGPYDGPLYPVTFKVVSAEDKAPLKNVEVSIQSALGDEDGWLSCGFTDTGGFLSPEIDFREGATPEFRFMDYDGLYETKDTTFLQLSPDLIEIQLKKKAE